MRYAAHMSPLRGSPSTLRKTTRVLTQVSRFLGLNAINQDPIHCYESVAMVDFDADVQVAVKVFCGIIMKK